MNKGIKIITLILFAGLVLTIATDARQVIAERDTTFENYMRSAWDKIRAAEETSELVRLNNTFSEEFYEYYMQYPQSPTGRRALSNAFVMWGNTGNDTYMGQVLETLDYDSEIWRSIILSIGRIYYQSENYEFEDYLHLLEDLASNLTDPAGRSEAYLDLLRNISRKEGRKDDAIYYARQLVELNATEFHVRHALGYLHQLESLNIGQKAPDFRAQTLSGDEITLADLKGNVVLLEFWATWCGPCLPEIPHLKTLHEKFKDHNFIILGISLDSNEERLRAFVEKENMAWPQIFEPESWHGEIPKLYNILGIPRMYLIGPDGKILARDLRGEQMIDIIGSVMAEATGE
jgi:peroxiredoxin